MKIIHDESFRVPSTEAAVAFETAQSMIAWATPTYPQLFRDFSLDLVTNLRSCFTSKKNSQKERELMWGHFHRLRCTSEFYIKWYDFMLKSIKCKPSPTFYQYITHEVFINEINTMYDGNSSTQTSTCTLEMTKIEENALRYVAGYVCRRTRINLETSTHPHKDEMIYCIFNLSGDDSQTEAWTNIVDRGGLWHVSDMTYELFHAIETEVRQHLTVSETKRVMDKQGLLQAVLNNADVLFQWCLLSSDHQDEVIHDLLKIMADLYITIRGYSFATSCIEIYKQSMHKGLQRSKGLRKELFTSKLA